MVTATQQAKGIFGRGVSAARRMFASFGSGGYDAVKDTGRRQPPTGTLRSEDGELPAGDRRKLVSGIRDINRNFAIASWMVRKHLDYITTFKFQARSGNPNLDARVEAIVESWSRPINCDVTARFPLSKIVRMLEARRVIDGDVFIHKMRNGRLNVIEGDRVRTPVGGVTDPSVNREDLVHGIELDDIGRAKRYAVNKRGKPSDLSTVGVFHFERMVPAKYICHFGYWDRFDQVRGISPLAPALNSLADVYKGVDLALAKMRVAQLFGLAIYRDKFDKMGNLLEGVDPDGNQEYQINFGKGPQFLDLNAGDRAEFLETNSPSPEFQQFTTTVIGIALKALDIPFSFYDESFTNYSGSRQAWLQYDYTAKTRRNDVERLLNDLTAWRLGMAIYDGELDAEFPDIKWEWIHRGIGWMDYLAEIQANIQAITNGLDSRTRIIKETTGRDIKDVALELRDEQQLFADLGISLVPAAPVPVTRVEAPQNAAA